MDATKRQKRGGLRSQNLVTMENIFSLEGQTGRNNWVVKAVISTNYSKKLGKGRSKNGREEGESCQNQFFKIGDERKRVRKIQYSLESQR